MSEKVIMVGPFPPPRHGLSTVNESVRALLAQREVAVIVINTAPPSLDRRLRMRVKRIGRIVAALRTIRSQTRTICDCSCYFSLSGGFGLIYEGLLAWVARRRGARIVVHHHSFRYLDVPFWPMRLLVRAAGRSALHVTLGQTMAVRLKKKYPAVRETLVLSNAGFIAFGSECNLPFKAEPVKVGFLANLSAPKGLYDFIALAEESQTRGLPWHFVMAGPYENQADHDQVESRIKALANIEYRGPIYRDAKVGFFQEIDLFVFPTRYRNEAEPLVVLEALSSGTPVIAFGRACIGEMIGHTGGQVIPVDQEFVGSALEIMEVWRSEGAKFGLRCIAARKRFDELQAQSAKAIHVLLQRFGIPSHE